MQHGRHLRSQPALPQQFHEPCSLQWKKRLQHEVQLRVQQHSMVVEICIPKPHFVSSGMSIGDHRDAKCEAKGKHNGLIPVRFAEQYFGNQSWAEMHMASIRECRCEVKLRAQQAAITPD